MAAVNRDAAIEAALAHRAESFQLYGIAANYGESLDDVLQHEGGYSNDPGDPGGPTKYGITIFDARRYWKADATASDVRNLPLAVAKEIYRSKYWDAVRGDALPSGVDYATFDYGVNSGVGRASLVLHGLLGLAESPVVDNAVVAAANEHDPAKLSAAICDERLRFLRTLSTWPTFGKGWAKRVADVREVALQMAGSHPPVTRPVPPRPVTRPPPTPPANKPSWIWRFLFGWP